MRKADDVDAEGWRDRGPICRHLGTEDDRSTYLTEPSARHRCYLWWQRDRIDLAHQAAFCLTKAHSECPWLSVSPPTSVEREGRILPLRPDARLGPSASSGRVVAILIASRAWVRVALIWLGLVLMRLGRRIAALALATGRWLLPATARLARFAWVQLRRAPGGLARLVRLVRRRAGASPPPPGSADPVDVMTAAGEGESLSALAPRSLPPSPAEPPVPSRGGGSPGREVFESSLTLPSPALGPEQQLTPLPPDGAEPAPAPRAEAPDLKGFLSAGRRLVKPPVITWRCSACEAINAGPSQVCTRCGRPSPEVEEQLTASGDELLTKGLAGLKAKNEDLAHAYFVLASEASPESELAWYWRAKTAPAIDEVVRCLECIVALNPGNTKAQTELESARQRQRPEQAVQPVAATLAKPAKPAKPRALPNVVGEIRWWALQLAGLCAFALSLALLIPYVLQLTGLQSNSQLRDYLALVPSVALPNLPVHLPNLPVFDVGPALPLLLGLLLLHAAFMVVSGGGLVARIWMALLGAGTAALVMSFGTAAMGTGLAIDLAVVAMAMALAGDARAGDPRRGEVSGSRSTL